MVFFKRTLLISALVLFHGCDRSATAPGDRSYEGTGSVAFRVSESGLATLRTNCRKMIVKVSGPGMGIISDSFALDSFRFAIGEIPCGTRVVSAIVFDSTGAPYWQGTDTVEVQAGQTALAGILLHRVQLKGSIEVELRLDNGIVDTFPQFDTVPPPIHSHPTDTFDQPWKGRDTFPSPVIVLPYDTFPDGWTPSGHIPSKPMDT